MIVVIQCAATKIPDAGHLVSSSGKRVVFVADPQAAPAKVGIEYARPDDPSGNGLTWRKTLLKHNTHGCGNPLSLTPAFKLYKNEIYRRLVDQLGFEKVFILSAGWGMIRSDFLTPYYDITFSPEAKGENGYKRRRASDPYDEDFPFSEDAQEEVVFFGGKDYLKLFVKLTGAVSSQRKVYYNSKITPTLPGCIFERFQTTAKTNWHYLCANAFLEREAGPIARSLPR